MKEVKIIEGIRMTDNDGVILFNLEDISRKLGFVEIKSGKEYVKWRRIHAYLNDFGFATSGENIEMVEESVFYRLAFKANNKMAIDFQKKVATEIIPEYRKGKIQKPLSQIDLIIQSGQILKEQAEKLEEHDDRINLLEAKSTTRPTGFFTVAGWGTLKGIKVTIKLAANIGRKASKLCKERGIEVDTMPDPRFGKVNVYPKEILDEVFNMKLTA